jgi:hypothetical protein
VRALSNEPAYWLAPVVSVPGSEHVLFDADDAERFAGDVRSELLESGVRVGEPEEPNPDGSVTTPAVGGTNPIASTTTAVR